MGKLIIDGAIVDNQWQRLETDALENGVPAQGKIIVPLAYWQENRPWRRGGLAGPRRGAERS